MTALNRALPLEEVDDVAVRVGKDLDLDVPRALDQPFDVERAVAERGGGFAPRGSDRFERVLVFGNDAHALAATAR